MSLITACQAVCGAGVAAVSAIGLAQGGPEMQFVQYGALGLAGAMVWFSRVDAREREKRMGMVLDRHEADMKELHEKTFKAIDALCQRPCMADKSKENEP